MSISVGLDRMEHALILKKPAEDEEELTSEPRPGDTCPQCKEGKLDYDSMLNLSCDRCGYSVAGCFT
jgi:ribosomal protein L37AE/L43A